MGGENGELNLFLEKGEGREKGGEAGMWKRNIYWLPLTRPLPGTGNRTRNRSLCRMTPNPPSHTSQGRGPLLTQPRADTPVLHPKPRLDSVWVGASKSSWHAPLDKVPSPSVTWTAAPSACISLRTGSAAQTMLLVQLPSRTSRGGPSFHHLPWT